VDQLDAKTAGVYALLLQLDKDCEIRIGALGEKNFPAGAYLYFGSAMNGLKARLQRHLRSTKKQHWHIDYLLAKAEITGILLQSGNDKTAECRLAARFAKFKESRPIARFGASDCSCSSHLLYINQKASVKQLNTFIVNKL